MINEWHVEQMKILINSSTLLIKHVTGFNSFKTTKEKCRFFETRSKRSSHFFFFNTKKKSCSTLIKYKKEQLDFYCFIIIRKEYQSFNNKIIKKNSWLSVKFEQNYIIKDIVAYFQVLLSLYALKVQIMLFICTTYISGHQYHFSSETTHMCTSNSN